MTIDYNQESENEYKNLPIYDRDYLNIDIPDSFDGRVVWKGLLQEPGNQKNCGACWAFATTSTLADKLNIQSLGVLNVRLSVSQLVLCNFGFKKDLTDEEIEILEKKGGQFKYINRISNKRLACNGNTLMDTYEYLLQYGTPETKCVPYSDKVAMFSVPDKLPVCTDIMGNTMDMCSDKNAPARFFRSYGTYSVPGSERNNGSELTIRSNIFQWGPVSTAMKVYPDFYTFDTSTIYEWNEYGPQIGGHAIEIVGWGEENGKKYWIIKNSWGTDWGDGGYFRMIRGTDNCGIESNVVTCIPNFFFPIKKKGILFGQEMVDSKILDDFYKQQLLLNKIIKSRGEGIIPETGYTKRAVKEFKELENDRPIHYKNWPNYATFVAGIDADVRNKDGMAYKNIKSRDNGGGGEGGGGGGGGGGGSMKGVVVLVVLVIIIYMYIRYRQRKN